MSVIKTTPAVTVTTAGSRVPCYTGPSANTIAATSFSIVNGVATIVLNTTTFPANGYNPQGYAAAGAAAASSPPQAVGQQVTLWGFTTATYFNGLKVTVIANNPAAFSFSFATTHGNVTSTSDAGNTAPDSQERFKRIRVEIDQASTAKLYVGDSYVSSSQYAACVTADTSTVPGWPIAYEFVGDNIDASRFWLDASASSTVAHVSLAY